MQVVVASVGTNVKLQCLAALAKFLHHAPPEMLISGSGLLESTSSADISAATNHSISGDASGSLESSSGISLDKGLGSTVLSSLEASGGLSKEEDLSASVELSASASAGATVTRTLAISVDLESSASSSVSLDRGIAAQAESSSSSSANIVLSMTVTATGEASGTATTSVSVTESEKLLKQGARSLVQLTAITEAITYYEGGDLSAGRTIRAVVERTQPELYQYSVEGESLVVDVELWICTDSTLGVSSVQVGRDLADVVVIEGESPSRIRIVEVLDHDPGMVHLLGVR